MGSHKTGGSDQEKVKALLELAKSLQEHLPSLLDAPSIEPLLQRLSDATQTASCVVPKSALKKRSGVELASRARELFNLCVASERSQSAEMLPVRTKLLLQSRLLAFLMMHLALWTGDEGLDVKMGDVELLFSMVFKVATLFIGDEDHGSAVTVLQKAAEYTLLFPRLRPSLDPDELELSHRLEAEYLILRTALALKESRIDVAEHMYAKVEQLRASLDPTSAENLAEVLFATALDRLSQRAAHLRLIIGGAFVNALLSTEEPQDFETASNIVQSISSEVGETPVVLVLRLEVLQRSRPEVFDKEAYATCILGLVRSFNHSEPYYRLIEPHTWNLFQLDQDLGCDITDEWLRTRIANSERDAWVERAVLRRLSMSVRQISTSTVLDSVTDVLVDVCVLQGKSLKASTAVAAHTIIWKKIETLPESDHAEARNAVENNAPKEVLLDVISHYIAEPPSEPLANYLIYKAGLRYQLHDFVKQGLEGLAKTGIKDPSLLYACILDAQKTGDNVCTYRAISALVDNCTSTQLHRPALLRSAIRCLQDAMGDDATVASGSTSKVERQLVEELCQAFEHAVEDIKRAPKDPQGNLLYTVKELHWFCKNSYNLGISRLGSWDLDHIIRMMQVGLAVREYYPSDIPTQEADDIRLRSTLSHFVVASAMVSVARTQDDLERQSQVYSSLRQHVVAFDTQIQERMCLNKMDKLTSKDLYQKFASLLVFDLEAAVHLKLYNELSGIVRRAKQCASVETFKSMADCLLRGHAPPRDLYSALRQIINEIWNLERFDPTRLAKYMRCLFQAVLPLESELGRQILQEAISKARASAESGFSFPPEEVQWLVTVA
ncbi:Oxalate decarboxylase oxdD [Verticillium dahliae VDG2]|nr:Oxalate decarboxylase oxdD [Verticillium dahliae VDG2]